jgi:Protein of unknown function (DUF1566)
MGDGRTGGGDAAASDADGSLVPNDGGTDAVLFDGGADEGGPMVDRNWAFWPMPNLPSSNAPNPQSYDTTNPDFVVDKVTGLTWSGVLQKQFDWDDAQTACPALNYGGYADWRLPTAIELGSIVNLSDSPFQSVDTTVFPNSPVDDYWTSTHWGNNGGWYIDFSDGAPKSQIVTDTMYVRCVRGGPIPTTVHYAVGSTTVTDNWTGLDWQQPVTTMTYDFAGATQYCADLSLDGHDDWRLPSPWELLTLADFKRQEYPAVDPTAFADTPADNPYWATSAWGVTFSTDVAGEEYVQSAQFPVRCVR